MTESTQSARDIQPAASCSLVRTIRWIQWVTVAWMTVEVSVALFAALRAHSVALAAFAGDSAIELFSAAAVLWRFSSSRERAELTATKITGWLLGTLAAFVAFQSVYTLLVSESKPRPSYLGIAVLAIAALVMPWLSLRKRQLAVAANSASLRADAAQSSVCAYMSWIALAGLLVNAVAHVPWADPLAALGLLPIILNEAKEAFEGAACCES